MSPQQETVYNFTDSFINKNGYAPTHNEIAESLKISRARAGHVIKELEKKGYVQLTYSRSRNIKIIK